MWRKSWEIALSGEDEEGRRGQRSRGGERRDEERRGEERRGEERRGNLPLKHQGWFTSGTSWKAT